ncbi:MAG: tetratricopeptide repeat protein [Opitutales bacterium]
MEEVALKDLDTRLQKQIENARKAVDKNPTYAVDILMNIVNRNPGCLEARKILRQAQTRAKQGKSKGLGKFLTKVTSIPFSIGSDSKVKKDPEKAMESAEDVLKGDPSNPVGHKLLGAAAEELELHETAVFAYEELRKYDPDNSEAAKLLMKAYIKVGLPEEAIKVGDSAYRKNPRDDEIQDLIKRASVQQTMEKGRWEEDKSFREKLANEDEAQRLEQASRAQTGEAGLRSLIKDTLAAVEKEPDNINYYRDLAGYHRKLGEYDDALEWVEKARGLESGKADVNLERLVSTIQREKMQKLIADKEAELAESPDDESLQTDLEKLRAEERSFRLEHAEKLVQRYPNEFGYRFELGELYFEDGEIDKAIKELQLALRSPKVRINALILLGKAYKAKGFWDLAAEQLTTAKSEIPGVTEQKKDVLYELGECYEQQGDMDKAIGEFKALYGADISYRDVAQKIDDFYSKKKE